jgi:hypothetical protein
MNMIIRKIPPSLPLRKGGFCTLWKRGARGDFPAKCIFNYETLNNFYGIHE